MKPFDPTKPCQFRDPKQGKVLRLLTDKLTDYPLCFEVQWSNGHIDTHTTTIHGYEHTDEVESDYDIVNIPAKREGWVNVYPPEDTWGAEQAMLNFKTSHSFKTPLLADIYALPHRIARVRIELPEE